MGVRLPTILGKAIDDTVKTLNDQSDEEKILDLVACIDRMEDLMEDLQNNQKLRPIKDDGEGDIPLWNKEIARFFRGKDFMNAPWLFAEAYKYRRSVGRLGALSFGSVTFPVFSFVLIEFLFVLGSLAVCVWVCDGNRLHECFSISRFWGDYDVFFRQKVRCNHSLSSFLLDSNKPFPVLMEMSFRSPWIVRDVLEVRTGRFRALDEVRGPFQV